MIPPNGASKEGTERFKKKHKKHIHPDKFHLLQDLNVSALALGTYLGNYDDQTDKLYEEAVGYVLQQGVNIFDTAINYRCQRSERAIGRAVNKLVDAKKIQRDEIVIATKGGFIPFDSEPAANIESYIKKNWIEAGIMAEEDIVSSCHCMHPAFLQNQIDQSLVNLQLDAIDIYYLHNPEMQLPAVGAEVFYRRLEEAFGLLEENVKKGKIQYYGLATWTAFREPKEVQEAVSLPKVMEMATKVGGDNHHFRALQLPYSMAMLEAISIHGQNYEGKPYPILPVASFYGLSVMISAPLLQSQLLNLPSSITQRIPGDLKMAQKALQFVSSTPAVTAALVGMKQKEHIDEDLKVLNEANWDLPTLQKICDLLVKK